MHTVWSHVFKIHLLIIYLSSINCLSPIHLRVYETGEEWKYIRQANTGYLQDG